jgi:glucose/arabinose dehydrogenase
MRSRVRAAGVTLVVLAVAACTGPSTEQPPRQAGATSTDTSSGTSSTAGTSGALAQTTLDIPDALAAAPLDTARTVLAPVGWRVEVWARLEGARLLAWTPDGRLLVSRPRLGDVVALTPGQGTDGPADATLVDGLELPHGLAFDGSTLYVAQSDQVVGYTYRAGALTDPRVAVRDLPSARSPELGGAYAHALKSVAVGPDHALYVSVGSTGNISAEDRTADSPRAVILRADPGRPPTVYATGVRNGTGLAVDPTGAVWTAVNNRDNIGYPYDQPFGEGSSSRLGDVLPDYVDDHPLEPLARLSPGRELGWPYCNPDPDVDPGRAGTAFDYAERPFVRDVQTNPDGDRLDCAALPPVEQGMGAHSAPLGLSFAVRPGLPAPFGPGALVGIHGSWNRQPPRPPEVAFFAWRDGGLGPQQTLLGGFQLPDGERWGRPVMAVQGPDGAVYVSDDYAGAVYRMTPP